MAKKKHAAKHRTTHRRRAVGAVNKGLIAKAGGTIVGLVVGDMIASKVAPTMDAKIKGAALAGIGLFVVPMVGKSAMFEGLALGIAGAGGLQLLKGVGIINGIGQRQIDYNQRLIAGNGINQMVNGAGINQMVNGSASARSMNPMTTALKYG